MDSQYEFTRLSRYIYEQYNILTMIITFYCNNNNIYRAETYATCWDQAWLVENAGSSKASALKPQRELSIAS